MAFHDYAAAHELERIAKLCAFNISGAYARKRINQHATRYFFEDGSLLQINHTTSRGDAWHISWRGKPDDRHLGPVIGLPLRINAAA